ncbi:GNAT family N-acetyltransferase [Bradyrhizobium sp. LA6.7]|uniref:GNAT family N-acetyltransferase n=1 Tax=unclassified Bradyrhizobium TaxID=2631580 RepID=UPI00339ADA53
MDNLSLVQAPPEPDEYIRLRAQAGWGTIDAAVAGRTLEAAVWSVCLRDVADRLVGTARVMGDGLLYFFLCDLVVDPSFRGGGLGERLMAEVAAYFDREARPGSTIILIPLAGSEGFYERFGFVRTPDGPFGQGMHYSRAPAPTNGP